MTQPEALRLADELSKPWYRWQAQEEAAAELRRLHAAHEISLRTIDRKADAIQELLVQRDELIEINRELLAALKAQMDVTNWSEQEAANELCRAAIAKGETK
jgi:hypothetical protein